MTFTIAIGWWMLPALVTIICIARLFRPNDSYGISATIVAEFEFIMMVIIVLFSWMVYGLLT